jgi:citrate synthase
MTLAHPGLEGVVAAATALSDVDGERGELTIAGYPLQALAAFATFEETTWLLWHGALPTAIELDRFRRELAAARPLAPATSTLVAECARTGLDAMDTLRVAAGAVSLSAADAVTLVAQCPVIIAAAWRLGQGLEPVTPHASPAMPPTSSTCSTTRFRIPSGYAASRPISTPWSTTG